MVRRFFRDSAVYGAGTILTRGVSLLLLPFYTRVLAPKDYGTVDLLAVFASLVHVTIALEISQGLARHFSDSADEQERTLYVSTAFWFTLAVYTVFATIGLLLPVPLAVVVLDSPEHAGLVRLGVLAIWANGLFYLLQDQLRWELMPVRNGIVSLLFSCVAIGATVLFVLVLRWGVSGVILGQLVGYLVAGAVALHSSRRRIRARFSLPLCRRMLAYSLPLVPASVAVFVASYVDRIAIRGLMTLDDVGIYGVSYRLASVMLLVMSGFQGATTPLVLRHHREESTAPALARVFRYFMVLALGGCLVLSLFARETLILFAAPSYHAASALVPLLAPALVLSGMYIFAPGLAIAGRTREIGLISIAGAALNTLLNFALIPWLGTAGSALATLLAAALGFVAMMVRSQRLYPVPHDWSRIVPAALIVAAVAGANAVGFDRLPVGTPLELVKALVLLGTLAALTGLLVGRVELAVLIQRLRQRLERVRVGG